MSTTDRVSVSKKIGYMCSGLSVFFTEILGTFVMYFATENLGIAIASISLMLVLVKILDGITDIICGFIIDRFKSAKGTARPWFIRMAIPYPLCMALIFFVPSSWGNDAQVIAIAVLYTLAVSVFGTVVGVARIALLPLMTENKKERGIMATLNGGASAVFAGITMSVAIPLAAEIGYNWTFLIFSVFACIMCVLTYMLTRERTEEISNRLETERKDKTSVKTLIKTALSNKYIFLTFGYQLLLSMASGFMASCGLYYSQYVMGDVTLFSAAMAFNIFSSIAGVIIGVLFVGKIGSRRMFIICLIEPIIAYGILLLLNGTSPTAFVIIIVVNGLFLAIAPAQTIAISANVADYGMQKTGKRTDGAVSSMLNLGLKIGSALSTAAIGAIMAAGGFISGNVTQSESAVNSIGFSFTAMPVIVYGILLVFFLLTYRIETKDRTKTITIKPDIN